MNAADVVGYTDDGEFYCADCGTSNMEPVFASSEFDEFPVCCDCGEECEDVTLTD